MLRIAYPRLASRLVTPHLVQASSFACRRTLFTTPSISAPQVEKYVTKEDRKEGKGIPTEDEVLGAQAPRADSQSTSSSQIISTKPPTGDWVLFHPVYTEDELKSVSIVHRTPEDLGDKVALGLVKLCRWGFDLISGYRHKPIPVGSNMSVEDLRKGGYIMTESEWLLRILFLESIAAVPGMVAATLRHLRSLRLMKRDAGWIHTLLEEAENERMHLMTFMTLKNPSIWFRGLILGAQGVFYNAFFLGYLLSPRSAHRFVGFLEEEAIITYTKCIAEIEAGRIPEWQNKPAPSIAIDYWRLPHDATLLDVIKAVRADESTHRFVNHSLANLKQKEDLNPFAFREPNMYVKGTLPGFTRQESAAFVEESRKILEEARH
ncbi:Alternative oxidase [Ceratobasidium theobromae]|uniref:Alternative oxidase n=1 Tax=Ceratobasidium theobromae TaxID=1582974 RepID=A0A5N5QWG7_9AGAM|nr:Alternative oxidase [Ceratobasidium theobromae]